MKKKSYLFIMVAAALWGGIGVFFKQLSAVGFSEMQVVAIRVTTAALILTTVVAIKKPILLKIHLRDCWCFIGTGIISLVFFNWCYFTAIELTSLGVAAVLLYTSPIFVMLLSVPLFGERMNLQKILALLMTFSGSICVAGLFESGGAHFSSKGIVVGVGAGIGYALYSIFGRFALDKGYDPVTISIYTFLFASLGALPLARLRTVADLLLMPETIIGALGIGIICCIFPFLLYTKGLAGVETGKAAVVATVEPAVATILGVLVYHEQITAWKLAGILLIFSSVVVLNLQRRQS